MSHLSLRLFESEDLSKIKLIRSWYHDNNTGRFIVPFKLKWHPQRDILFSPSKLFPRRVCSYNDPYSSYLLTQIMCLSSPLKQIEAWNSEGVLLSNLTSEDHLQSISPIVCHHELMTIVAGGNGSGRVYLFHKDLKPVL